MTDEEGVVVVVEEEEEEQQQQQQQQQELQSDNNNNNNEVEVEAAAEAAEEVVEDITTTTTVITTMMEDDKIKEAAVVAVSQPVTSSEYYFKYNGSDDDDIIPNNIEHLVIGINVKKLPSDLFTKHNCKHSLKILEFAKEEEEQEQDDDNDGSSSSPRSSRSSSSKSKLRSIGDNAFERYEQLQQILNIPSSLMVIGNNSFRGCVLLESITFASSSNSKLEMIRSGAFYGCMKLNSIVLPNSIHTLGKEVFQRCHHLETIQFGSELQTIGDDAFERCKKLKVVNFPKSIIYIGNNSFNGCESLTRINFESCNNTDTNNTNNDTNDTTTSSNKVVELELLKIGIKAFFGCEKLQSILLPCNISYIGERAFSLCDSLTKVEFVDLDKTNNLHELSEGIFYECVKLTYIELPKNLFSINKRVFYNCFALTTIYVPSNSALTTIDDEACKGCNQLFNFHIPNNQNTAVVMNELHKLLYHHDYTNNDLLINKLHDLYDENPTLFNQNVMMSEVDYSSSALDIGGGEELEQSLNMTPLHIYVASTTSKTIDLDVVKILIETFPQSLISDDKWGRRPIHYACMTGSIEGGGGGHEGHEGHGQQILLFDELTALSRSDTSLANTPGAISVILGEDLDGNTPLTLGIRYGYLSLDVCVMLYGLNPISFEQIDDEDMMYEETLRLTEIITAYINTMITTTTTTQESSSLSPDKQHGWVNFLKQGFLVNNENNKPKKKKKKGQQPQLPNFESLLSELIDDDTICNDTTVTQLAYAQDYNNQKAIDVVQGQIKIAFENRLSSSNDNDGTAALVAATTVPTVGSREAIPPSPPTTKEDDIVDDVGGGTGDDNDGTAALLAATTVPTVGSREAISPSPPTTKEDDIVGDGDAALPPLTKDNDIGGDDDDDNDGTAAVVAATTVAAVAATTASRDRSKDKDRPGKGSLSDKPMVKPPDYDDGVDELPEKPEIPPPPPDYVPPVFEEPSKPKQSPSVVKELSRARVASIPVNLYTDEQTGQQYFFLKRFTFPQRKMNKLFIRYEPNQVDDVLDFQQQQQQLESPEQNVNNSSSKIVMLYNCPVECHFEGGGEGGCAEPSSSMEESTELLTDKSFQLKGFKIRAIRIRMYMKQKLQAQQQLSQAGGNNSVIKLNCDIECRLVQSSTTTEPESDSTPLGDIPTTPTKSSTGNLVGIGGGGDDDNRAAIDDPPFTPNRDTAASSSNNRRNEEETFDLASPRSATGSLVGIAELAELDDFMENDPPLTE